MSFLGPHASLALTPDEINLIQRVYDRVVAESWVVTDPEQRLRFANYILGMYDRGLCIEDKLYSLCLAAAKAKFSNPASADDLRKVSGQ